VHPARYPVVDNTALHYRRNKPSNASLSHTGGSNDSRTEYVMELDFAQPGDSYGNGQTFGKYDSGTLAAGTQWVVDWSHNPGDVGNTAREEMESSAK